jgi:hypothetical protein
VGAKKGCGERGIIGSNEEGSVPVTKALKNSLSGYTGCRKGKGIVNSSDYVLIASLLICPRNALPQQIEKEPAAGVELGVAPGWNLKDGGSSIGPTVAVEVTPIENWLELEFGVTPTFAHHLTELDTDLLFKKPWTLSTKVEFMVGVGPVWLHTRAYGMTRNSVGGEAVLDFMFWPSRKHRFGWYLEPGYEYNFGRGHEQSVGISGGLLIAIR